MTLESMQVGSEGVSLQAQEPDMTTQTVPVPDSPSVLTIESPRAESPSHSEKRAPSSTNSPTAQAVVGTSSNWWAPHPENPRNWEKGRKWRSTIIMSLYTLVCPLASTMIAPAIPDMAISLHITSSVTANLVLTIFLLAFAFGPLVLSPISEVWGRLWVLHICNLIYLLFNVACALAPSTSSMLAFRFLAGIGGSAPMNIGGGVVTDLFDEDTRTAPIAVYMMMTLLSPVAGPIAGGFLTQRRGYEWTFWLIAILSGASGVIALIGLEETFGEVVRKRVAKKEGREDVDGFRIAIKPVADETNKLNADIEKGEKSAPLNEPTDDAKPAQPQPPVSPKRTTREHLITSFTRPLALLFGNYICFALSLYSAVIYGYLYLLFATFPVLFAEVYHWRVGVASLAYIGPGVGSILATIFGAILIDKSYKQLTKRNPNSNNQGKPEYRLPTMVLGSLVVPAGLLWYGWSADRGAHWILPILGSGLFAVGTFLNFLSLSMYLVDTFYYSASALAAVSVLRSLFGFAFPLFGQKMFDAMGIGPGYSMLAGISLVIGLPFPIWLFIYGERLRSRGNVFR